MLTATERRLKSLRRHERAIIALHVDVAEQIAQLKKMARRVKREKGKQRRQQTTLES
jgi:hypothetical protein